MQSFRAEISPPIFFKKKLSSLSTRESKFYGSIKSCLLWRFTLQFWYYLLIWFNFENWTGKGHVTMDMSQAWFPGWKKLLSLKPALFWSLKSSRKSWSLKICGLFIFGRVSCQSKWYNKPNSWGVKPKEYGADVELSAKNWTWNSLIT